VLGRVSGLFVVRIFLTAASRVNRVVAPPLTPFKYEAQAHRHCPDDTVVWLDFRQVLSRYRDATKRDAILDRAHHARLTLDNLSACRSFECSCQLGADLGSVLGRGLQLRLKVLGLDAEGLLKVLGMQKLVDKAMIGGNLSFNV
jgi:hypothetical protein